MTTAALSKPREKLCKDCGGVIPLGGRKLEPKRFDAQGDDAGGGTFLKLRCSRCGGRNIYGSRAELACLDCGHREWPGDSEMPWVREWRLHYSRHR